MVQLDFIVMAVRFHFAATNQATSKPPITIVIWIPLATKPLLYAIDPQTTKVPAEK